MTGRLRGLLLYICGALSLALLLGATSTVSPVNVGSCPAGGYFYLLSPSGAFGCSATPINSEGLFSPPSVTPTTMVQMGLGVVVTPTTTGRLLVSVGANLSNTSGVGDGGAVAARWGTGTPPSHGASPSGTQCGPSGALVGWTAASTSALVEGSVHYQCHISGLTPGSGYWIDPTYEVLNGGTLSASSVTLNISEF